jgi:predicted nucleotidyltransferase
MRHLFSAELDEIVSIIKKITPDKIYLFGSRASGGSNSESDIDLLVVARSTESPFLRRIRLRKMLKEYDRRYGLDLLVYTPEEYDILINEPASFISSSLKNGIKIYDVESC